jgi:hypothetical protein
MMKTDNWNVVEIVIEAGTEAEDQALAERSGRTYILSIATNLVNALCEITACDEARPSDGDGSVASPSRTSSSTTTLTRLNSSPLTEFLN